MGLIVRVYDIVSPNDFDLSIGESPYGPFTQLNGPNPDNSWPGSTTGSTTSTERNYRTDPIYIGDNDPEVVSGVPPSSDVVFYDLEFDTEFWLKIEDKVNVIDTCENNQTPRYIVENIYIHDSKTFECYDKINFSVSYVCATPTPTPTPQPTSTPLPTPTPSPSPTAGEITPTPTDIVVTGDTANCGEGIDMVFILDRTGSMATPINNLKNSINSYAQKVIEVSEDNYRFGLISVHGDNNNPMYNLRLALAPSNEDALGTALNTFGAQGGGGFPEPTDNALEAVLDNTIPYGPFLNNTNKIIVMITDATPSGGDDQYVVGVDDVQAAALATQALNQNVRIFAINTGNGVQNNDVISIMQNYASTTFGQYAESPDGSVSTAINDALDDLCDEE